MTFEINQSDIIKYDQCPCCSSKSITQISECNNQEGVTFLKTTICNNCGHIFRENIPSETWFNLAFKKRHEEQQAKSHNPLNPEIEKMRFESYHAIGKLLKNFSNKATSLLDIGCGPGTGLDAFTELGFSVVAVDPDESRARFAIEKGHHIHLGEFQTFETDRKFDIISMIHSLEHFQNPDLFLKKAMEYAHPETLLYVGVPEVLDHVLDWNDSLYLAHVSNFNPLSLIHLAAMCGWKFVENVNPYANTNLPQGSLAMIFRPIKKDETHTLDKLDSDTIEEIRLRYYNGLEDVNSDIPVKFVLKEINDISLAYKGIKEVKKNVHDNYMNRILHKIGENTYSVS